MQRSVILFCAILCVMLGCQPSPHYSTSLEIENGQWAQSDTLIGAFQIEDTLSRYDLYLDINHSTDYRYENVYLEIKTEFPHKDAVTQVLPIDIANKKCQWYGKCSGNSCNLRVVLRDKTKFDAQGKYQLSIAQYSRENSLDGINELELIVMESE